MAGCEHKITQTVKDEVTHDLVSKCCQCDNILGFGRPNDELPTHWFDHTLRRNPNLGKTADSVLSGEVPANPHDERYVRICGNCGNWMDAVHSGYFDDFEKLQEHSFAGALRESVCAECGCSLFRDHQFVASLSDARALRDDPNRYTQFILNTADMDFWHSNAGGKMVGPSVVGQRTRYIDNKYACRCPSCGYAVAYGSKEFDFHHWDYDDDIGCMLCRTCHSTIHRNMTAAEQRDNAGTEWQRDAVPILYKISTENGLSFDNAVEFCHRFNIPPGSIGQEAASELFAEKAVSTSLGDLL